MVDVQPAVQQRVRKRDLTVDTVRGIACILLVTYHVIGFENTGLRLSDDEPIREFNSMLIYLRMPLFTILSGYVYSLRPFAGDAGKYIRGKATRLLVPMLVVGTLFAVVQSVTPGANGGLGGDGWYTIHIVPVAHFWYLEALFWVFLVVMVLEQLGWLRRPSGAAVVIVVAATFSSLVEPPRTLGLEGAVYLLPFFVFGVMAHRFRDRITTPWALGVGVPVAVVSLGWCVASVVDVVPAVERTDIPATIAGCAAGIVLLRSGVRSVWLARIGLYSYTIYLFHTFGTSATRIALERAGVEALAPHLVLGVIAGVAAPMVLDLTVRRWSVARTALLGRRRAELA